MQDLVTADQELNGGEFEDVYENFQYPEAQDLSETREKLYLKLLTQIAEGLDTKSSNYEIM